MYYTATEKANMQIMAGKIKNDSQMFNNLIESDIASKLKQDMVKGDDYFRGLHDYLDHRNYYYLEEGQREEDVVKANNLVPNPFDRLLKLQKRDNIIGKPISITVARPDIKREQKPTPGEQKQIAMADEYQTKILAQLSSDFDDIVSDIVIKTGNNGVGWLHPYIDPDSELKYVVIPAIQIIPFFDMQYEDRLLSVIRYYSYQALDEKTNTLVDRYKVEWWDDKQVTYWEQQIDRTWLRDSNYIINPYPHWFDVNDTLGTKEAHGWGRVPFVFIPNNSEWSGDLTPIKPLIDAYDKVYSGLCNDLEDFQQLVYIVKNMQGMSQDDLKGLTQVSYFLKNIKTKKVAFVEGDGDVTNLKSEIPTEAIDKFLDITKKAIYRFGQGVDTEKEDYGTLSGRALQILYAGLYSKCDSFIMKAKKGLRDFIWFVTEYINQRDSKNYDYKQVVFTFNRSSVVNEQEIIQGLAQTTWFSTKLMLQIDPRVDNVDDELAQQEAEKAEEIKRNRAAMGEEDNNAYDETGQIVTDPKYEGKLFDNLGKPYNHGLAQDEE